MKDFVSLQSKARNGFPFLEKESKRQETKSTHNQWQK